MCIQEGCNTHPCYNLQGEKNSSIYIYSNNKNIFLYQLQP
jgi:hypothetical protein